MRAMLDAHKDVRCGEETRVVPRLLQVSFVKPSSLNCLLSTFRADEEPLDEESEGELEVRGSWSHWRCPGLCYLLFHIGGMVLVLVCHQCGFVVVNRLS